MPKAPRKITDKTLKRFFPFRIGNINSSCVMRQDGNLAFYISMDGTMRSYHESVAIAEFIVKTMNEAVAAILQEKRHAK